MSFSGSPIRKVRLTGASSLHIGRPAGTLREVIDTSYTISWCIFFAYAADQQSYQIDPIHLRFVEECSHLWNRVLVYDSVDI